MTNTLLIGAYRYVLIIVFVINSCSYAVNFVRWIFSFHFISFEMSSKKDIKFIVIQLRLFFCEDRAWFTTILCIFHFPPLPRPCLVGMLFPSEDKMECYIGLEYCKEELVLYLRAEQQMYYQHYHHHIHYQHHQCHVPL